MAISKIVYKTSPQDTGTVWMDATPATASASDITAPKTAMLADGVLTTGTGSGGGGGLEYEEGTYTPVSDIAIPTISFANSHDDNPMFVMLTDTTGTDETTPNTNFASAYTNLFAFGGNGVPATGVTNARYGLGSYIYRGSSGMSGGYNAVSYLDGAGSANYQSWWVTPTGFKPNSNSTTRYWLAGRTYKWIAVWA